MDVVYSSKRRKIYFIFSSILIIASLICIFVIKPKIGIDFAGGTLMEFKFNNATGQSQITDFSKGFDFITGIKIQKTGDNTYLIRTNSLGKEDLEKYKSNLASRVGEFSEIRLDNVGPTVSNDATNKAIWATIIASIGIILYVAYTFRSIPKPASSWRFGVCAITALVHDLIISIGIYTLLGYLLGYEIDSLFVVAVLTILGYSVNDTIVIFDRIRENLKTHPEYSFAQNVNTSLVQSLARSLNTSLTVVIVLLALLFLGGESMRPFIALMLTGVVIGTYSSIFVAPPLLIAWQNKIDKKIKLTK